MKSLVFPRIFLHCVALGFIVSGLLLSMGPRVRLPPGTPIKNAEDMFLRSFSLTNFKNSVYSSNKTAIFLITRAIFGCFEHKKLLINGV